MTALPQGQVSPREQAVAGELIPNTPSFLLPYFHSWRKAPLIPESSQRPLLLPAQYPVLTCPCSLYIILPIFLFFFHCTPEDRTTVLISVELEPTPEPGLQQPLKRQLLNGRKVLSIHWFAFRHMGVRESNKETENASPSLQQSLLS